MKLPKTQIDILDKMDNGWELGLATGYKGSRAWLQKGGLGYGGDSQKVHRNTLFSLEAKGLIKRIYGFPTSKFITFNKKET